MKQAAQSPRVWATVILAVACIWRGGIYAARPDAFSELGAGQILTAGGLIEPWVIGATWITIGVVTIVAVIHGTYRRRCRAARIATSVLAAAWLAWGLAYLVSAIVGLATPLDDWLSAGTHIPVALAILACNHLVDPIRVKER